MRVCETGPEWGCPPPGSRVLALGPPPVTPLAPSLLPPPAQPWGVGGWGLPSVTRSPCPMSVSSSPPWWSWEWGQAAPHGHRASTGMIGGQTGVGQRF